MSLRPIIPAAPITRIFNGVPSLFLDPAIVGAERARSPRYTAGASGSRILAQSPDRLCMLHGLTGQQRRNHGPPLF